jgi:large repetitive protein
MKLNFLRYLLAAAFVLLPPAEPKSQVVWAGRGSYRLLVKVEPLEIGKRAFDQMPAEVVLSFKNDLEGSLGIAGKLDASSMQVIRYNADTGQPLPFGKYAYGTTPWDCPFRWYDDAIPYSFPDYHRSIAGTNGEIKEWNYQPKWGHLFGTMGDWKEGHLAWVHTQEGSQPSYYAIYFDVLPPDVQPSTIPPAGFLGDAMERREPTGLSTTGLLDSRVAIDDWNNDGLFDVVVGSARGVVVYYPNVGTKTSPKFTYSKLVFTDDGKPLDVGISSEPIVVDWDGDGVKDLLVGANGNRLLFFKNIGSNDNRSFVNRGFVSVDGSPISLPHEPVPGSKGVFHDDYHPVPEVVDWDGDGDIDLLLGGYVTGMIFYFENTGRSADGTPTLKARGPLEADGKVLDVEWCAAPTVADFDGDGDLDLISGTLRYTKEGVDPAENELFLRYFENVGSRTKPVLKRMPFPKKGEFPHAPLVTPRVVDFNGDGLPDLVVSALDNIYLFPNVGTRKQPVFEVNSNYLPSTWGNAFIADIGSQLVDWNGDGAFDIVTRFSVRINENKGWPNVFRNAEPILAAGESISHPAPMGDNYSFTRVADLDGDGKLDILFGDHGGNIYFHKNLSTANRPQFETKGVKLMMESGIPIKVGPEAGATVNFQVLQGARTTFTVADFNRDGKPDLVVGDTYGKIRYYENKSSASGMAFSEPLQIGDLRNRMSPSAADWNEDGYPDVIGVASSGEMELYLNSAEEPTRFLPGTRLTLPTVPYWSAVNVVDWNGDGDQDVMIATDYLYFAMAERSYIEHGYAEGLPIKVEKRASER